jgi:2-polyprenyl-6-hydroxyphenyl methylase/3-demethylubiquinone-9 3-methyltransferase
MSEKKINYQLEEKLRFKFGNNWKNFLQNINKSQIQSAENSLKKMLKRKTFKNYTFLDVGSGSGLFSLAARNLGAKVTSFDFDKSSVWCTNKLKNQFYKNDKNWKIIQGSILDRNFLTLLGKFDIVYSWGVLHHTGNMWLAMDNITKLVKKKGFLFIALYNHQQFATLYWTYIKIAYNKFFFLRPILILIHFLYPTIPSLFLKFLQNKKIPRGMTLYYDLIDWLGGYPFETSIPENVFNFYRKKKFALINLKTVGGKLGCNEFVFQR